MHYAFGVANENSVNFLLNKLVAKLCCELFTSTLAASFIDVILFIRHQLYHQVYFAGY